MTEARRSSVGGRMTTDHHCHFLIFIPFIVLKQNTSWTQVPEIAFCLSQQLLKFTLSVSDKKTLIWAASESSAKWCILSKTRHQRGNWSQLFKWYHCLGCACKGSVLDIDLADSLATAKRKSNSEIPNGPRHSGVLFQLQLYWHCPRQQDVHVRQLDNTSETKKENIIKWAAESWATWKTSINSHNLKQSLKQQ